MCAASNPAAGEFVIRFYHASCLNEMKKTWISFVLLVCSLLLNSQTPSLLRSSLSCGGALAGYSGGVVPVSFPQSIGQYGISGVFVVKNFELRQGFIQPVEIKRSSAKADNTIIRVYPNPFTSVVFVQFIEKPAAPFDLWITDLAGRQVFSKTPGGEMISQVDLSSLKKGIYILVVRYKNIHINYKIIKH